MILIYHEYNTHKLNIRAYKALSNITSESSEFSLFIMYGFFSSNT